MQKSKTSELRIASAGDIHLGHRRNPTSEIVANLRAAFPDNAETGQLDIIFFNGDVFDDLLSLPDEDVVEIDTWIAYMLRLCKKHDIMLRVLEGTPGHDWKQSERFEHINRVADIGADLKYVKDLSIEYVPRHGIHVGYVPDEWEDTTDKTLSQFKELLRAKGLTQVDYLCMHGQFEHQLPPVVKAPKHSAEEYSKLVRGLIFINHVHTFSRYLNIVAPGSFDRLVHGEEEAKGHVRVVARNGEHDVQFVETVNAKKFVTVHCMHLSLEETIEKVNRVIGTLPEGSFVRVESNQDNPVFTNMEELIRRWPFFTWSKLVRADEEEKEAIVEDETIFVPITLTRENLPNLLMERLAHRGAPGPVLEVAEQILKDCL